MNDLYQAQRSPIQNIIDNYQSFGAGTMFLSSKPKKKNTAQSCGLIDLTNLPRVGFRGTDTAEYLSELGFELPQIPNRVIQQQDGGYIARLSATEYLLIGSLHTFGQRITSLEQGWMMDDHLNYLLPRQDSHALFQLSGSYLALIMAKLCAVDLSEQAFTTGQVVQTSVARINAIVMNISDATSAKFNILCDRTMALYFWDVLSDAMQEFNGQVVGVEALI